MKLYSYWRSTSSYRVRIALQHKGIAFEYCAVNLLAGEQHDAGHVARSPTKKIPVLEVDEGHVITESMAIVHYLDEIHGTPPLLPRHPYLRARARMLAEIVNSGIQPFQNTETGRYVKEALHADPKAWTQHWVATGLASLEEAVKETAGRFCVGDEPTIADVYLVPQLYGARRYGVDLEKLPTLLRIEAACQELEGFQKAGPELQPDAPKTP